MNASRFVVEHIRLTTAKSFDEVRAALERQLGRFDASAYQSLAAGESVEKVKSKIEAMAGSSGLMLFATHDHGTLLRLVGLTHKAVQYVVGNPLYAVQITQHSIGASLYAPLRVLLCENDEGQAWLEYDKPSSLFGQFGDERVNQAAAALDEKLAALAAAAMR